MYPSCHHFGHATMQSRYSMYPSYHHLDHATMQSRYSMYPSYHHFGHATMQSRYSMCPSCHHFGHATMQSRYSMYPSRYHLGHATMQSPLLYVSVMPPLRYATTQSRYSMYPSCHHFGMLPCSHATLCIRHAITSVCYHAVTLLYVSVMPPLRHATSTMQSEPKFGFLILHTNPGFYHHIQGQSHRKTLDLKKYS